MEAHVQLTDEDVTGLAADVRMRRQNGMSHEDAMRDTLREPRFQSLTNDGRTALYKAIEKKLDDDPDYERESPRIPSAVPEKREPRENPATLVLKGVIHRGTKSA